MRTRPHARWWLPILRRIAARLTGRDLSEVDHSAAMAALRRSRR